jgi:ABC-type branched-subunit amino acid transport system substrate-binding protein
LVAAERLGITVVGTARWDARTRTYRSLARRIRAARARAVLLSGLSTANGPQLIKDLAATLGPDVHLLSTDGFQNFDSIVEVAGDRAEGFRSSIAELPERSIPPAGRRFAAEFQRRFSQRLCCFSLKDAQAMHMLLDAIAGSGGHRAAVARTVMRTRVRGGLVGDFAIDRFGDTTLNTIGIYRVRGGLPAFETAINPAPELLARE